MSGSRVYRVKKTMFDSTVLVGVALKLVGIKALTKDDSHAGMSAGAV